MRSTELLQQYRSAILEMDELSYQLDQNRSKPGTSKSYLRVSLDTQPRLINGLEALLLQKRDLLAELAAPVWALLSDIKDGRLLQIIQRYYLEGMTDRQIAHLLRLTTTRINQIRRQYLQQLEAQGSF
nr:hypothetical protein [Clostridia bacterium]